MLQEKLKINNFKNIKTNKIMKKILNVVYKK